MNCIWQLKNIEKVLIFCYNYRVRENEVNLLNKSIHPYSYFFVIGETDERIYGN